MVIPGLKTLDIIIKYMRDKKGAEVDDGVE